jgi:ABC-type molybdate transport system substrate-binding protein
MLMRRLISLSLIALLVSACWFSIPRAEAADHEVNVAAAADLSSALQELGTSYEKRTGVTVKISFGASGALTQQIQNGAPFDIFFSADMDYPHQLIAGGQADGATLYRYAVGRLVLWVPMDSPLDVERKGMDVLLDPSVKKISMERSETAWCSEKIFRKQHSLSNPVMRRSASSPWLTPQRQPCRERENTGSSRPRPILSWIRG